MIQVDAVLDTDGVLRSCKASGHAGAGRIGFLGFQKKGTDIVCAAVTILMRTALDVLSGRKGITIHSDAPKPGFLCLELDYSAEGKDFLYAIGVFLIDGLRSVAQEYPRNCNLKIITI
jgi:uncharacterized protein YsxB (DUF464 family)